MQHFQSISLIGKKKKKTTLKQAAWRLKGLKKSQCGRILHHIMEMDESFHTCQRASSSQNLQPERKRHSESGKDIEKKRNMKNAEQRDNGPTRKII